VPIGSVINPRTGRLDLWKEPERITATVHFDTDDPAGRFIAGKVQRGICRSCSLAFIPIRAVRRDHGEEHRSWKAEPYQGKPAVPTGFDYLEVMVSELSIVGVGANPRALLEGAPEGMAKALRCIGGKCFSSWAPDEPVDPVYATVLKEFRGMKRML